MYVYVVKGTLVVADVLFRNFARRLDSSFRIRLLYLRGPIRFATLAGGNLRGFIPDLPCSVGFIICFAGFHALSFSKPCLLLGLTRALSLERQLPPRVVCQSETSVSS